MLHFLVLLLSDTDHKYFVLALWIWPFVKEIGHSEKRCLLLRDRVWIYWTVSHPNQSYWTRTVNASIDLIQAMFSIIGTSYITWICTAKWLIRMMNRSCIEICQLLSHAFQKCCWQSRCKWFSCKTVWRLIWSFVTLMQ